MVVVIAPYGDFAVNDDWGFSTPVRWWTEDGDLRFTFHQAMTLITQVFLGFLWSEAFGFSQFGLRILVALMAALFLIFVYGLARRCGMSKQAAFLLSLPYLAFPHFIFCSVTFLTETPFLALSAGSLYFYVVAQRAQRDWLLPYSAAMLFLVAAILTRQVGLFIALGFAIGDISANGPKPKILLRAGAAFAVAIVVIVAFPVVIEPIAGLPEAYSVRTAKSAAIINDVLGLKLGALLPLIWSMYWAALYFGLLMIPLCAAVAAHRVQEGADSKSFMPVSIIAATALLSIAILARKPIPVSGDTLSFDGLGARFITPYFPEGPIALGWWVVTLAAALSFGVVVAEAWRAVEFRLRTGRLDLDRTDIGIALLLLCAGLIGYLPYGMNYGPWYARYILLAGVCALLISAKLGVGWDEILCRKRVIVVGFVGVGASLSSILARDFFDWSRTRYDLIDEATTARGIDPDEINGGFEYNNLRALLKDPSKSLSKRLELEEGGRFLIAKAPQKGYVVVTSRKVGQILPLGGDDIYLLRMEEARREPSRE